MSQPIYLDLPNELAEQAQAIADRTHRPLEDVLLEWLGHGAGHVPVDQLPDDRVLALCDAQMSAEDQADLSELLVRQREDCLVRGDRERLAVLLGVYRQGMVLKAQALKVAVDRGLRPPVS